MSTKVDALLRWVPAGLALLAEGAWTYAVGAFTQEFGLQDPVLSLPWFAAAALAGMLAVRTIGLRWPAAWQWTGLALVAGTAVVGVLAVPAARDELFELRLDGMLREGVGGLFLGAAFLRGTAYARLPLAYDRLARLVVGGTIAFTLVAALGAVVTEPYRTRFEAQALSAALVFAASSVLALALTRLSAVGASSGVDWRRNPVWLATVVALVVVVLAIAVLAAGSLRAALELAAGLAIGPLLILGLIFGWGRWTFRTLGIVVAGLGMLAIVVVVGSWFARNSVLPPPPPGNPTPKPDDSISALPPDLAAIGLGLLAGAVIVIVLLLLRRWLRAGALDAPGVDEDRMIDLGTVEVGAPRHRRWRLPLRASPTDAASAYRALMEDLQPRPVVARAPGETPREHAHRLRVEGWGRVSLDLLAADYALSRFADQALSATEHRRGIRRWRLLRADLLPASAPSIEEARPSARDRRPGNGRRGDDLPSRRRPGGEPKD